MNTDADSTVSGLTAMMLVVVGSAGTTRDIGSRANLIKGPIDARSLSCDSAGEGLVMLIRDTTPLNDDPSALMTCMTPDHSGRGRDGSRLDTGA